MPLVRAGRLLKSHGVHGFMKCVLSGSNPIPLEQRGPYWLYDPRSGELLPLTSLEFRPLSDEQTFLLRIAGWTQPEQLRPYQGWELLYLAQRGSLPREAGEVYFFELVGLEVRDTAGQLLGRVCEVLEQGARVLLELDTHPARILPFDAQTVPEVNLEEGYLVSSYPGLPLEEAR